MKNNEIKILLAAPRGFCAGVERAIEIVEKTIEKYGAPVFVRHEIVHNKFVVDNLKTKGAVFIEELDEIIDKSRPVIFSAHGVPKCVPDSIKCPKNITRKSIALYYYTEENNILPIKVKMRKNYTTQWKKRPGTNDPEFMEDHNLWRKIKYKYLPSFIIKK